MGNSAFGQDNAPPELDRLGGWKGKTFKATGFFRTENDGKRWWLVTPEGSAFLSFGINHIHPGWWSQPYNRDAWMKTLGVPELRGPEFGRALRAWFMEDRHLFGFNTIGVHNDLRRSTDLSNGNETRDNVEFLKRVVDKYYLVARDAIRRHDPNHLFVGDKLHANTDSVDTVLPVTSKYTDIVFYQMYAKYGVQELGLDRWTKIVDQPFINGDSSFASITKMTPRPLGPIADDQQQKARWAREFIQRAFARPDFVGWHYCGLIDTWNSGGTGSYFEHVDEFGESAGRQHTGLLMADGTPYQPIQKVLKESTDRLYQIAMSKLGEH